MALAALIDDISGIVCNIIVAGDDYIAPEGFTLWTAVPIPSIGDTLVDGIFVKSVQIESKTIRVNKADFQRLLKASERYTLNALRKQVASLIPEDYLDPSNVLLLAAEDVLFAFEQPLEFIELDHKDTSDGLSLLAYLGVIEFDRIPQILACEFPG